MEHANGAAAVLHALQEARDGLLIVGGEERGGEPQAEGPRWEHPGAYIRSAKICGPHPHLGLTQDGR